MLKNYSLIYMILQETSVTLTILEQTQLWLIENHTCNHGKERK